MSTAIDTKKVKYDLKLKKGLFSDSKVWTVAFLVTMVTLFIYLPALQNDFVNWDDDKYVYENQNIQAFNFKLLKWSIGFHTLNWHPLTFISHSIDYALWGLNPMGHHLSSILFHSANTFLLYILIIYLLANLRLTNLLSIKTDDQTTTKTIIAAAAAALLFGIHPIHVESVAWVAERKDVLSTFFVLLSLIFYCKYVVNHETGKQLFYYSSSLIFFILALMSKPMAVTLPFILVIMDIYPFQRLNFKEIFKTHKRVVIEKIPFLFFSAISTILTIIAQHSGGAITSLKLYPLSFRMIVALRGLSFYLEKIIFPIGLSPFYPLPNGLSVLSFESIFPMTLVAMITTFCALAWKRGYKVYMIAWAYYVLTLLPVIGIIQVGEQAAADRYSYIPSMGPFLLIGLGISIAWAKISSKASGISISKFFLLSIAILLTLNVITAKQITIWSDSTTLWSYELKRYPDFWLAYYNRAHAYTILGDHKKALEDLDKVIEHNPKYWQTYYIYAINHIRLGDYQKALKELDKTISHESTHGQAYYYRAHVYTILGDYQKALKDLDKVIELKSEFVAEAYRDKYEIIQKAKRLSVNN